MDVLKVDHLHRWPIIGQTETLVQMTGFFWVFFPCMVTSCQTGHRNRTIISESPLPNSSRGDFGGRKTATEKLWS